MAKYDFDYGKAMKDPQSIFGTPERLLADPRLDREGKREILQSWEQDARELAVAEEEGMHGGEKNMLHRVLCALDTVSDGKIERVEAATKKGSSSVVSYAGKQDEQSMLVMDIMRPLDEIVHVDHNLHEAFVRMKILQLPFLPVVDGDEIVGILTARDIYGQRPSPRIELKRAKVRDHLSKEIAFCYETDDLYAVKEVIDRSGYHRLLVVDCHEQLVGSITLEQITAALREHGPTRSSFFGSKTRQRLIEARGRAKGDTPGKPPSYAVRPRIKR